MNVMFWVWLGVIVVATIAELATMEVVSIWFALGAVIPFIMAGLGVPWQWQLLVFGILSATMIVSLRGITKRFLLRKTDGKTNLDAIVGQKVRMITRTDFETIGTVKINDVVWNVIGEQGEEIEAGDIVEILRVEGNKFVVKKVDGGNK